MSERNCNKCIHHTSGNCDSWDCKMQTVEDVKKEAVNEYVKSVVEKLERIRAKKTCNKEKCDTKEICRICVVDDAIEIVKAGVKNE